MKKKFIKHLLTAFFIGVFGVLAFGQPIGAIRNDDEGGICTIQLLMSVKLANLDLFSPAAQNGIESLPTGYPEMWVKYSLEGSPFYYLPVTHFQFDSQVSGVNLYEAILTTYTLLCDDLCPDNKTYNGIDWIPYTMEIVTPNLQTGSGYIPYSACDYASSEDIFSCVVFPGAGECLVGRACDNDRLTYFSGNYPYECSEGSSSNLNTRSETIDQKEAPFNLSIRPNPFMDHLEIQWSENSTVDDISIFDTTGKLIKSWNQIKANSTLYYDTTQLPKGLYFVKIRSTASTEVVKVIKQ